MKANKKQNEEEPSNTENMQCGTPRSHLMSLNLAKMDPRAPTANRVALRSQRAMLSSGICVLRMRTLVE